MNEYKHHPRFETHISITKNSSGLEAFFRTETLKRNTIITRLESSGLNHHKFAVAKSRYLNFTSAQAYTIGNRLRTEDRKPKSPEYLKETQNTILSALKFVRPFTETQRANYYRTM